MKAKWVRIELRKVETLPGGGVANTFFDFVGQSPINLWQSPDDEYNAPEKPSPLANGVTLDTTGKDSGASAEPTVSSRYAVI